MSRLSRILSALRPCRIDQVLYVATHTIEPTQLPADANVELRRFDVARLSGKSSIDNRIGPQRECYTAWVDGVLAHESWLRRDVLLPRRFGFSPTTPVIGDSQTLEPYRGRGLYRRVLQHIVQTMFQVIDKQPRSSSYPSHEVYILVSPANVPSIRGIEAAGFQRLARLQGWRIGGLIWRKRCTMPE